MLNINALIKSVLRLISQYAGKNHLEFILDLREIPEIVVSAGRFQQLMLNLLLNAMHSMSEGGEIYISTSAEDEHILISVKDSGCGIAADIIDKIFDPFFSTKGVWGKSEISGTGLGLSVCRNIVHDLAGTIDVVSEEGHGAEFTVRLPVGEGSPGNFPEPTEVSDRSLTIFTANRKIIDPYLGGSNGSDINYRICSNLEEFPVHGLENSIIVLDGAFPGIGELYKAAEFCRQKGLTYIVINAGENPEYEMRGLTEHAAAVFRDMPASVFGVVEIERKL